MSFRHGRFRRFASDRRGAVTAIFAFTVLGGFFVMIFAINNLAEFSSLDRTVRNAARSTAFQLAQSRLDWSRTEDVNAAARAAFDAALRPRTGLVLVPTAERTGATVVVTVTGRMDAGLMGRYDVRVTERAPLKEVTVSLAFPIASSTAKPRLDTVHGTPPASRLLAAAIVADLRQRLESDHRIRVGFVPFNQQIRILPDNGNEACIRNRTAADEPRATGTGDFPRMRCSINSATSSAVPELAPPRPIGRPAAALVPDPVERNRLNEEADAFQTYVARRLLQTTGLRHGGCRNITLGLVAAYDQIIDLDPTENEAAVVLIVDGPHSARARSDGAFERDNRFCETGATGATGNSTLFAQALENACIEGAALKRRNKRKRKKDGTEVFGEFPDLPLRLVIVDVGGRLGTMPAGCREVARVVDSPATIDANNAAITARAVVHEILGTSEPAALPRRAEERYVKRP